MEGIVWVFSMVGMTFGIFGLIAFLRVHQLIAVLKQQGTLPEDFDGKPGR
jgi:hypothetical protein